MPPHCDSMDGPVVQAAHRALEAEDVDVVLPYVHQTGEEEVRWAFDLARKARTQGPEAREVADLFFYVTVVRVHRAGEGAPYTGLKPAGLDVGPVIPLAEAAIKEGSASRLAGFLADTVRHETVERFDAMLAAESVAGADGGVDAERNYVRAMLGLEVWAHKLYEAAHGPTHHMG